MMTRTIVYPLFAVVAMGGLVSCQGTPDKAPEATRTRSVTGAHGMPGSPQPGCTKRTQQIAFVSTHTGKHAIHLVASDASRQVKTLVRPHDFAMDPAWSPDGRRIAFRVFHPGSSHPDVYVAQADGSDPKVLVRQGGMPSWSPHGRAIAFANLREGSRGISVVDVAEALGGKPDVQVLTRVDNTVPEEQPAWSPDGEQIAFTSHREGSSDVWIIDASGGEPRNLTNHPALDNSPAWSPDGTLIAFGSTRDSPDGLSEMPEGGDIYLMNPEGGNVKAVTTNHSSYSPDWSPDGCLIAFNAIPSSIRVIDADGQNERRLTPALRQSNGETASMCCPAWKPTRTKS